MQPPPSGACGKPHLPAIDGHKHLADYVGPETRILFDLIGKHLADDLSLSLS